MSNKPIYVLNDEVGSVQLVQSVGDDTGIVNAARTKTHEVIIEAYKRGYRVNNEGELFNPSKELKKFNIYGSQRYPTFSIHFENNSCGIPVHQFAAFCFYGYKSFLKDMVVRHLNANTLDVSKRNIVLGTCSDNELDKPKEDRIRAAKIARASQGITPTNRKLTDNQVKEIREIYKNKTMKKLPNGLVGELCKQYKVSKVVLSKISKGVYYASVK